MAEDENNNNDSHDDNDATCCNDDQQTFLQLYLLFLVVILVLTDTIIFKPLRLLATAIHEFSHAFVCWATGGNVQTVQIYGNEGGVTRYRGGCRILIAPAGYLGEAVCGMLALVLSGGRRTATGVAVVLVVSLFLCLFYSPNRTLVILSVVYIVITVTIICVEWFVFSPILQFVTMFGGVFLGMCAIKDIVSHLVIRSQPGSDAYALYEETGRCCPPRCVGFVWLIVAFVLHAVGVWLALILMSDECADSGWFQCVFKSQLELEVGEWDFWPDDWDMWDNGP